jgi:hypothetical protein
VDGTAAACSRRGPSQYKHVLRLVAQALKPVDIVDWLAA